MEEIEVKILEINAEGIMKSIEMKGGKREFEGVIKTRYFDYLSGNLAKKEMILRLREYGNRFILALKRRKSGDRVKVMEEYETQVENPENMLNILQEMGLEERECIEKKRISYNIDDMHIDIDIHENIPPLMEIEGDSFNSIVDMARELGFKEEELRPWSIWEVFNYYAVDYNL